LRRPGAAQLTFDAIPGLTLSCYSDVGPQHSTELSSPIYPPNGADVATPQHHGDGVTT